MKTTPHLKRMIEKAIGIPNIKIIKSDMTPLLGTITGLSNDSISFKINGGGVEIFNLETEIFQIKLWRRGSWK